MNKIGITGIEEIDEKLRNIEPKLAKKFLRKAIRKGAKPMLAMVKSLTPVEAER